MTDSEPLDLDNLRAYARQALARAEQATPGLDLSGSCRILEAWKQHISAESVDNSGAIAAMFAAESAKPGSKVSGDAITQNWQESRKKGGWQDEGNVIRNMRLGARESKGPNDQTIIEISSGDDSIGLGVVMFLPHNSEIYMLEPEVFASIARDLSEQDLPQATREALTILFLVCVAELTRSEIWLSAVGIAMKSNRGVSIHSDVPNLATSVLTLCTSVEYWTGRAIWYEKLYDEQMQARNANAQA